ncbi:flagellin [Erwinia sp. OLTSP20]|uniref:FliC/FljB family flagellin n=1 Tax=unclassified Erwinia TaxID=2622719 RepID=UPI000C1A7CD9|nr:MULTISPECIES: FliC/FljB family flagellin [unclassified Erwinia]PIJ48340.1 flagellin [Erwinia sp. OAMSP11]PIJ68693.1 flagellin [Erwinia sp. OLSSP12]PIJ78841.1 flagellin [Erwinia sp. OLCASP19]PIJ79811.1 flagellin [Erwinia sp. OLMTSP26]PIJ81216.1 flagellin [Erwinia sp. OLMDSP33]
MSQVINTNSFSLITQNNMKKSQSALSTAIERLSSGLRINSAKDDAAGQAIANRFTSNIEGLTQAARNANDGISIAQTTEGSLSEINNNLQRIRELTVQAQNGTNNQSDLDSIQDEITTRLNEIDRVSGQTQFNGVKVLSGDNTMKIQVGANDGETITIDLKAITSKTLGLTGFNVNGAGSVANTAATKADFAGITPVDNAYTVSAGLNKSTAADVLASLKDGAAVNASITNGFGAAAPASVAYKFNSADNSFSYDIASSTDVTSSQVQTYLAPKAGDTSKLSVNVGGSKQDVILSSDGKLTAADDGAVLYLDTTGNLTKNGSSALKQATLDSLSKSSAGGKAVQSVVTDANGTVFTFAGSDSGTDAGAIGITGAKMSGAALESSASAAGFTTDSYTVSADGAVTDTASKTQVYTKDDKSLTTDNTVTYYLQDDGAVTNKSGKAVYKDASGKFTTDATTKSAATSNPLASLDAAISTVDKFRSSLGAIQNRFDSAINNLNNTTTNLSAAQSRIQDADYATEVSNMSKAQILQQAGNSVLAKANQVPQQVLSLLQG